MGNESHGKFIVATLGEDGKLQRRSLLARDVATALAEELRAAGRRAAILFALTRDKEVTVVGFDDSLRRMTG